MLTVHTLASGSEGNCLLLSGGSVHLLVDAGISARRITASLRSLGLSPCDVAAVLLTHEHTDHTAGLATLTKQYRLPLYASDGTAAALSLRCPALRDVLRPIPRRCEFALGDVTVTVFPTSHDAAGSVDYRFDRLGASVGVLTDTGFVTDEAEQALRGVGLMVLEATTTWSGFCPARTPTTSSSASRAAAATCPTMMLPPSPAVWRRAARAALFWPT